MLECDKNAFCSTKLLELIVHYGDFHVPLLYLIIHMSPIHAVVLGIVEGITEFLPVSSTFHLLFTSLIMGLYGPDFIKLFEVFIQSGAILAVILIYLKEIRQDIALMKKVFVSFVPTAVIGFLLFKVIKNFFFENYFLMVLVFFLVGVLFLGLELLVKKRLLKLSRSSDKMTYQESFIVGLVQALAVIPGVSRAGAVIVSMMGFGYTREDSVKYSFLLSVPTIVAASAYDLYKSRHVLTGNTSNVWLLAIGFVVSFLVAYMVIKWFIGFVKKNTLELFGYYRILLVIILLVTLWFRR